MHIHLTCLALWVAASTLTSSAIGSEPVLKAGVRLPLGGPRLQGWAAPDVADWNNDGLNDVIVGHDSGSLFVYLNRGVGTNGITFEKGSINRQDRFGSSSQPYWAWRFNKANCVCPGPGRISPRIVDWDNDGKKDLVIGDGRGAQTRIWRNIGTDLMPVFSTHAIQYLPPDAGVRPYHETVQPCVADWNGDGNKDLIMGRNRGVYVYLNEGSDAAPKFDFDRSRLGMKIRDLFPAVRLSPAFVDWDGDGLQDLIVGTQQGEVWFAKNVGSNARPSFNGYSPVQAGGKEIQVRSEARITVADLDGDGRNDLLVGASRGAVWFFQTNQPNPIGRSQHVRLKQNVSVPIELVGTDDAGRQLAYRVLTQPKHGTLTGTAPNLKYTPKSDYEGPDQFTFKIAAGNLESAPATIKIEVQPPDHPPTVRTQPTDALVGIGQSASFHVVASGTPPFSYEWKKDGKPIPQASGPTYTIRETKTDDSDVYSVTVKNAGGIVSSRNATLQVKPFPQESDDVPIIEIAYQSPVVEPATPGVLTLTRTGNTSQAVDVKLTTRRGHNPVIADLHYIPLPPFITLKAGQTAAEVLVRPIDDTLVNGAQTLQFLIVPSPAYKIGMKSGAATMRFLDDDCPRVGISLVKNATPKGGTLQTFQVTAEPAPRRDIEISYAVSGTAVAGVDYKELTGSVTIPAGETSATIVATPYKKPESATRKTLVLTLLPQPFTYFDFYEYLTEGRPRTARADIASSDSSPAMPKQSNAASGKSESDDVVKLRREISNLGWIVFSGRSSGLQSDLDLYLMRPDGSKLQNITNTPEFDEYGARFSPDGKRLLYRRESKQTRVRLGRRLPQDIGTWAIRAWPQAGTLFIANADGSAPKPMGTEGDYAWATWGPEGKRIACLERVKSATTVPDKQDKRNAKPAVAHQIVIRDSDTLKVIRTLPSGGIHRQAIWSPDGKRICGPANFPPGNERFGKGVEYPLGVGQMASLNFETGKSTALARFPDWSPVWATDSDGDWFQGGSPHILHSANNYGICPAYFPMLWRSGLQGEPSELVYGEFKKHIWGGCTSPDDRFAIFVIGGNTWPLQGKMAIIRLADAPIARGRSALFHEVLADFFPKLKQGPVLDLLDVPAGFEPHWALAKIGDDSGQDK